MILVKGDLRKQGVVLGGGCAGTPTPWVGMLGSARDTGTSWRGCAGIPRFQPGMLGTASSLGHCLIQRVFPLFFLVLSTWHFIRVPQAEDPVGAAGITANHTEAKPELETRGEPRVEPGLREAGPGWRRGKEGRPKPPRLTCGAPQSEQMAGAATSGD